MGIVHGPVYDHLLRSDPKLVFGERPLQPGALPKKQESDSRPGSSGVGIFSCLIEEPGRRDSGRD